MNDLTDSVKRPGTTTIAAILGVILLGGIVGLMLMGGQVSTVLSAVGHSIGGPNVGSAVDAGPDTAAEPEGGEDQPADANGGQVADAAATRPDLLIIRTGTLEIEVEDLGAAVSTARARVAAIGGFSSASEEASDGDDATASVTFRIPADRWDDAMAAIRGLATETRHALVETEAVTNQVVDLGARITNLRASEAALQKIMEQATKIPDVLEVQAKLSDVRGEIERLVAQKGALEEQAAFGTLTVVFVLPASPVVEEVKAGWDPAADADAATGALIGLGQRAASFGIWVGIVVIPIVLVALSLLAMALVVRRLVGRQQAEPS
jgi:hypothetical protein